jgi:hypothetical protein
MTVTPPLRRLFPPVAALALLSACLSPLAPPPGPPSQEVSGDNLTVRVSPGSVEKLLQVLFDIELEQEVALPASAPQRTVRVDVSVVDPDGILLGPQLDDFKQGDGTSQPGLLPNAAPGVHRVTIESVGADSVSRQRLQFVCMRPGSARVDLTIAQIVPGDAGFTAMGTISVDVTCQVLVIPPTWSPVFDLPFSPWTFVGGIGPTLGGNHEREGDPSAPATPPAAAGDILDLDPDRDYAIVTGSDRLAIIDLVDGAEVERLRMPFGPYRDAVLMVVPDNGGVAEWLIFFDDDGGFNQSPYNPTSMAWGIVQQIPTGGAVTDLVPGATDAQGRDSGFIVVNSVNNTVQFWVWNDTLGDWGPESSAISPRSSGAWRDGGNAVSAVGGFGGTEALVAVADGANAGQLWLFDSGSLDDGDDRFIDPLGVDPTQLRCLVGVCLVTNFGDDSVTSIAWTPGGDPRVVETVGVDDGPRSLDLIPDPDGDGVAALVTSASGGSVTLLRTDGAGAITRVQTTLLGGCESPASAHFTDGEATDMLVACGGSNEIFLAPR